MRETWDSLWGERGVSNIEEVVAYDGCFHLLKRLVEFSPDRHLNVLEVGCGSGIYTLALLRNMPNYPDNTAVLVDYSPIALGVARKNGEKNSVIVNLVLADAFKLPFPNGTFDIVWNAGVNEHFKGEERQSIFNEMARVCKSKGQVVVIVPNSLNMAYRLWKRVLTARGKWQYGFEMPYNIFELKGRMVKA
ncbi:MAG: class I SAM-dependent methyltransferase, partial [Dehalococcoidales bacterium]|nr:class I SAM-dependent methyltransferase [Dehalococcoidales bacterium]